MKQLFFATLLFFTVHACHGQWRNDGQTPPVLAFGAHDTNLFVSVDNTSYPWHLVYRFSPNNAQNWTGADAGIDGTQGLVTSFSSLGKYLFAGQSNGSAVQSSDNGSHWISSNIGSPIISDGAYLFGIDGFFDGAKIIYFTSRSRDMGSTWDSVTNLIPSAFAANGACVYATASNEIWRSLDTGNRNSWFQIHPPFIGIMTPVDSILFIVGNGELAKSTDSGSSWSMVTVDSAGVPWYLNVLATDGNNLFAGTKQGILVSTDTGHSWKAANDGILYHNVFKDTLNVTSNIQHLMVFDTLLFVDVTYDRGPFGTYYYLFDRPISELTAKSDVVQQLPPGDTIEIYPNPTASRVSILSGGTSILDVRVLNVLGTEVLNSPTERASSLTLDLSQLPSGTYFLHIETPQGMLLRKVIRQ